MDNKINKEDIKKICPSAKTIVEFYNDDISEINSVCEMLACDEDEYFLTKNEYELLINYNNYKFEY